MVPYKSIIFIPYYYSGGKSILRPKVFLTLQAGDSVSETIPSLTVITDAQQAQLTQRNSASAFHFTIPL